MVSIWSRQFLRRHKQRLTCQRCVAARCSPGSDAAATRAERREPQHRWCASLRLRVRAEGGESSPGGRAAPSSSLAMGAVSGMVTGGSWAAGEADCLGEACGSACGGGDVWRVYVMNGWMK